MKNTVVVTGSSGLLGKEIVNGFLRAGWHVIGVDKQAAETTEGFDFIQFDLSEIYAYPDLAQDIAQKATVIKCLVNNAARNPKANEMASFGEFATFPLQTWEEDLWINLTAPTYLTQALLPLFSTIDGNAKIINMISTYGQVSPNPALYANGNGIQTYKPISYCASKAGLAMVTKYLAVHLAKKGFNVNGVAPGGVYHEGMPDDFVGRYSQMAPQGRMALPEEIAQACLFLAGKDSEYINGHILAVDGGWVIW